MAFHDTIVLTVLVLVVMTSGFRWKDCANDPYNAAFTFSTFNVWPIPAVIPGELHFSAALTVNRRVHNLYIDEDVNHSMFGDILQLPCLGVGIGTCNNIDCCRYQELNIPQLWERFMFYILGNETVCPVESKSVLIQDEVVYFPAIPKPLRTLAKNNYTVRLHFKDDVSRQKQIGCLEFDFEFSVQPQLPVTAIVGRRDLDEHVDNRST